MTKAANQIPDKKDKDENRGSIGLHDSLVTAGVSSIFALLVCVVGGFNWWAGLALFVVFIIYTVSKLFMNGLAVTVGLFTTWIIHAYIRKRGLRPSSFDKAAESLTKMFWLCLPMGLVTIYLLVLAGGLSWFFIFGNQ